MNGTVVEPRNSKRPPGLNDRWPDPNGKFYTGVLGGHGNGARRQTLYVSEEDQFEIASELKRGANLLKDLDELTIMGGSLARRQ